MIKRIRTISSNTYYPYFNLALEKHLFDSVDDETVILYLWQNERSAVCGYNQNIRNEFSVTKLIEDGGYPVRRLSGGGTVFQDKGALNFTFLTQQDNYDIDRQLQVITEACRLIGLTVDKTAQNDLTMEGRKCFNHAFYTSGIRCCHHGTLMVNVSIDHLSEYLNTDSKNPTSNPVHNLYTGAANLTEFCPSLTMEHMEKKLFEAFEHVYGISAEPITAEELDFAAIDSYEKIFHDDTWIYGRQIQFGCRMNQRFSWGDFDLNMNVEDGIIKDADLYSDAADGNFITSINHQLKGKPYSCESLSELVRSCCTCPEQESMADDICAFLQVSI